MAVSKSDKFNDFMANVITGGFLIWMAYAFVTCDSDLEKTSKSTKTKTPELSFTEDLDKRIKHLSNWEDITCILNITSIKYCLNQFSQHADILARARKREHLAEEDKQKVSKMAKLLKQTQQRVLPKMRDDFGPSMRKALWEQDIDVKTTGAGYRTASITSWRFASNAGIKEFQSEMQALFYQLRFNQTRYRWQKMADEYTYFNLDTPSDSELVQWMPNSSIYLPVVLP